VPLRGRGPRGERGDEMSGVGGELLARAEDQGIREGEKAIRDHLQAWEEVFPLRKKESKRRENWVNSFKADNGSEGKRKETKSRENRWRRSCSGRKRKGSSLKRSLPINNEKARKCKLESLLRLSEREEKKAESNSTPMQGKKVLGGSISSVG